MKTVSSMMFAVLLGTFLLSFFVFTADACTAGSDLEFQRIGGGRYGGINDRQFLTVSSEEQWEKLWGEINGNVLPLPPTPFVDFDKSTLAAIFQGLQRSGGYSISVERVIEGKDRIAVRVREVEPGPRNIVTMALSSPWEVVAFPRTEKPVIFTCSR
ncbi:MAG: protease complex subunit PrcB family protein [Synergistaceae bacterium]|nr:protease complex subunit PrcB family protein [Synergistaceae bacterium]